MIYLSKEGLLACAVGSLEHRQDARGVDVQDLVNFCQILGENIKLADCERESSLVSDFYEADNGELKVKDYELKRNSNLMVEFPEPDKDSNEKWVLTYTYFNDRFRLSWLLFDGRYPDISITQLRVKEQMAIIRKRFEDYGLGDEFEEIMTKSKDKFKMGYYERLAEEDKNKKVFFKSKKR